MTVRYFAIPRKDGGVEVMQVFDDGTDPAKEVARWHPDRQADVDVSGIREIKKGETIPRGTGHVAWLAAWQTKIDARRKAAK